MPRAKRALPASRNRSDEIDVRNKPLPPDDLWAQLDAVMAESGYAELIDQPAGTFTAAQYARRYNLNPSSARARIIKLTNAGKLEHVGRGINNADFYRIKK